MAATELVLTSGNSQTLLTALEDVALDVVLLTELPPRDRLPGLVAHRLSEQPVAIHGTERRLRHPDLATLLSEEPVILPTESSIRTGFDSLVDRLGITPRIAAIVDDMAMVRLLARDDIGLAITPPVVLADELAQGLLVRAPFDRHRGELLRGDGQTDLSASASRSAALTVQDITQIRTSRFGSPRFRTYHVAICGVGLAVLIVKSRASLVQERSS